MRGIHPQAAWGTDDATRSLLAGREKYSREIHMRLGGRRTSSNIEDRRGMRVGRAGGIGLGTVVLALIAAYFGVDPGVVLQNAQQPSGVQEQQVPYQESGT